MGVPRRPPAAAAGLTGFWFLALSALLWWVPVSWAEGASVPAAQSAGDGVVVRSVDGDTLVVDVGGSREDVRLIGIDTPESVARDRPVECFGPEAKEHMAALLPEGTAVRLERGVAAR